MRPQNNAYGGRCLCRFMLQHKVGFGEVLKLVGSAPELGGGQPDASPTLSWSQGDMWSTEVALGPGAYDFKVLVYNRSSQAMQWEGLAGSRLLLVPSTPGLLLVSCQWGSSSLQTRSLSEAEAAAALGHAPLPLPGSTHRSISSAGSSGSGHGQAHQGRPGWGPAVSTQGAASHASMQASMQAGDPPRSRPTTPTPSRTPVPSRSQSSSSSMDLGGSRVPPRGAAGMPVTTRPMTPNPMRPMTPTPMRPMTPSLMRGGEGAGHQGLVKVFVGNLPPGIRAEELQGFFTQVTDAQAQAGMGLGSRLSAKYVKYVSVESVVGYVRDVVLIRDRHTGTSKGMAFVLMDLATAQRAIARLHGSLLSGRRIVVELSQDGAQGDAPRRPHSHTPHAARAGSPLGSRGQASDLGLRRATTPSLRQGTPRPGSPRPKSGTPLEEEAASVSQQEWGTRKQLVVFFGNAGIGTRGGRGAKAVLQACHKVVERANSDKLTDRVPGRVVTVDEFRTSRVSSILSPVATPRKTPVQGKEYLALGFKKLRDRAPKAQAQQPVAQLVKAIVDKKRGVKANCANVQKAREVTAQRRAAEAAGPIEIGAQAGAAIAAEAQAQADAGADEADAQLPQLQADLQHREQ
ncbi:hypothetical protein QJQ45_007520 [Haematococcus lacustris]|nr:hypothetical protein QJQ45_007520 [Haematococcus lacustris]